MSILNITGLKKILGSQEILNGVDLRIDNSEKVGCVGRNGEGKTTLLRLIEGELAADSGQVQLTRGARMGYVVQRPVFDPGMTVRGFAELGLAEVHRVEAELDQVNELLGETEGDALEAALKRHGELTARMEFLGGWESERRVETVLGGIGLPRSLWDRDANTLSGGEKNRTALARQLVRVPDLLLLDEPTNHLDLAGIEWLESYLKSIGSAVFMVSHDRRLLEHTVDTIVEIERGRLVRYPGNYSKYVWLKAERFQQDLREWEIQRDYVRKEEGFIRKHMGSQRTAEAKGKRKRLQNLVRVPEPHNDVRKPVIRVASAERGGEIVLEASGLAVGHDGKALLTDINLRIGRGERIGIVGPNGSGKTTLMQALAGRMEPIAGTVERGYKAHCGYYDQETSDLRSDGTPFTEIRRDHPKMTDQEVRSHLARFLFRGSDVDLQVSGLSGGERARLSMARLVLTGPSWLAMDEPTNHLDLAGRTALEEMLGDFHGALIVITHDREFLDGLTNRIVEVRDGTIRAFSGNYSDYRKTVLAEEAARLERGSKAKKKPQATNNAAAKGDQTGKPSRPGKSDKAKKAAKAKPPKARNPWRIKKLEDAIMALEEQREQLREALGREDVYRDASAAKETQLQLAEIERDLEEKNLEWEQSI